MCFGSENKKLLQDTSLTERTPSSGPRPPPSRLPTPRGLRTLDAAPTRAPGGSESTSRAQREPRSLSGGRRPAHWPAEHRAPSHRSRVITARTVSVIFNNSYLKYLRILR